MKQHGLLFASLAWAAAGCATPTSPPGAYLATEPITVQNAGQLAHVVSWRLADHSPAELLADPARAIGPITIDADRQSVLVNRCIGTGSRMLKPVGIEEYALADRRLLCTTRIPAYPDLTGLSRASSHDAVFDLEHRRAYLTCGWATRPTALPFSPSKRDRAEPVDIRAGVVALDLDRDAPRLLGQGIRLAKHPIVDEQRLLVESVSASRDYTYTDVAWIDRERAELGAWHLVPTLDAFQSTRGGVGPFVLAWVGDPVRLVVLRPGTDGGQTEAQYAYSDGWTAYGDAVDGPHSRWVVAEKRGAGRAAEDRRVRVYEVPSLRPVLELPADAFARTSCMTCVGRSSLLAVVPQVSPNCVVLFGLDTGCEVARLPVPDVRDPGSWIVFADDDGSCIGVRGSQWMHLLAVAPAATPSAGDPDSE